MLFMGTLLFPANAVSPHDLCELFFFGKCPEIPFGIAAAVALEALLIQCHFQRDSGVKTALAAGGERYEIDMQMRCCLVHVQVCGEHFQVRVTLLESPIVFIENPLGELCVFACGGHVILISDLHNDLMEELLLLAGFDVPIVVCYLSVTSFLFRIVSLQSIVEQIMIDFLDGDIAVIDIETAPLGINIFCRKGAIVVTIGALPCLKADGSQHCFISYSDIIL